MINAVVYTSNTGHTKEYASLLGQEIDIPVYELKEAKKKLPVSSKIIYLGWLMAGTVKGYKKAKKTFDICALCGVGMAANGSQIADIRKANKVPENLPVFSLQGGFEMEKLHGIYKFMMQTMRKTVEKNLTSKKERTAEEDEMLDLLLHGKNRVSKDNLDEIIHWYKDVKE